MRRLSDDGWTRQHRHAERRLECGDGFARAASRRADAEADSDSGGGSSSADDFDRQRANAVIDPPCVDV